MPELVNTVMNLAFLAVLVIASDRLWELYPGATAPLFALLGAAVIAQNWIAAMNNAELRRRIEKLEQRRQF